MKIEQAIEKVEKHLVKEAARINNLGSALSGYINPNVRLKIQDELTEEYDFGWVFFYNSVKFIETGDFRETLGGNAPLIVNKNSGDLIETGTAQEASYYINNYTKTGDPHLEK